MSLGEYFGKAFARPLAVCGLFLGLCGMTSGFQANSSIWYLLITVSWQGFVFLILAYTLGLESSDRKMLQQHVPALARVVPLP